MQDLIQNYVSDLHKLREVFHKELEATAEELSKAMALYARRCDAALESFMEKASARESELESSAAARLSQFCGVAANSGQTDVDNGPPTQTPSHSDAGIAASAERAVADSLASDRDGIVTLAREERERTIRGTDFHAATTISRHVVVAAARSTRCD
jgi:hypothetical protein